VSSTGAGADWILSGSRIDAAGAAATSAVQIFRQRDFLFPASGPKSLSMGSAVGSFDKGSLYRLDAIARIGCGGSGIASVEPYGGCRSGPPAAKSDDHVN
jgi:hypothetical protein